MRVLDEEHSPASDKVDSCGSSADWSTAKRILAGGRLSVIMPVYNLGQVIADNLAKTIDLYSGKGIDVELIPVDDGSTDGTWEAMSRFEGDVAPHVTCRPVKLERNGGKGAALKAGFNASLGEYVLLLDGDLDINPRQTNRFFEVLDGESADIVVGSKRHPESIVQYPWHRRIVSWVYFTLVRLFIGLPITDTQTGMKLFRRKVLSDALARMLVKTYAFDLELLAIACSRGAKVAEAPVVIRFGNKFGALSLATVRAMAHDSLAVFYRLKLLGYYESVKPPKTSSGKQLVSVVIACPERTWMLEECLAALEKQSYRDFEVIVLPDSETGKVRPAEKRNIGIRRAKGSIVAFIDDDARPEVNWIENAVGYFSDPSIGMVGGPGVTPPEDGYLSRIGGRIYGNVLVSGNYRYRFVSGGICRDVDDLPSCNLFARKSLLDSIGGYRTDFWPGEDTLLCKDVLDAGARIAYDPWVTVFHHRRPFPMPHLRQISRYAFHRGYFCRRFPSNSLHLSYFIPTFFVLYLVSAAVAMCLAAYMPGCGEFLLWYAFGPLAVYLVCVSVTSFSFNPCTWLLTAAGVLATHVVYGVRFATGLFARRAKCEFIGKDHARK